MSSFQNFSVESTSLINDVMTLQFGLARRFDTPSRIPDVVVGVPMSADRETVVIPNAVDQAGRRFLDPTQIEAITSSLTPPEGIYGTGIAAYKTDAAPAVFTLPDLLPVSSTLAVLEPTQPIPLHDTVADAVIRKYVPAPPVDTVVVALPLPNQQFGPGDGLRCLGQRGRCGVSARDVSNAAGFLTAGHVASSRLSFVDDDAGGRVGSVGFTDRLASHRLGEDCADVAFVALDRGVRVAGGPRISQTGKVRQWDAVTAYGKSGPRASWVRALVPSFALNTTDGAWGSVFITADSISDSGDSGAPVLLDGTDTVVGLIVAGDGATYSIVQQIDYVLSKAGAILSPSS
jgi:hypothetical protein